MVADMKDPAPLIGQRDLRPYSGLTLGSVLFLAFLLRLWKSSGTFLNLDEAMHFLAANKPSLAEAYRASLNLAHPPLLILLLNIWSKLGTSELFLRLPSVIAGTIFCWIFFKWLARISGPVTGWVGLLLVSFLPPFVELSSEIRQYALLLCFMIAGAYVLELALGENSVGQMSAFFIFLYLAMLTHFSAILFAGAVGIYSLWRLCSSEPSRMLVATWVGGQAGALGLFVFLFRTHISSLKISPDAQHMQIALGNSYFHLGHTHLLPFIFARTFGVFQYTFGQLAVGDIAGGLFVFAIALLLSGTKIPDQSIQDQRIRDQSIKDQRGPSPRELGTLLVLPFVITCGAAIAGLYPYGGTRHSALIVPFAIAGVSCMMAKLSRQRLSYALGSAVLIIFACQIFGSPHRPYMRREDQRRANMTRAIDALRREVSPADTVFVDFQSNVLLRFYLCPEVGPGVFTAYGYGEYSCGGYSVISTSPETNILTPDVFSRRLDYMASHYNLKPNQTIWVFQAGWDIGLARDLPAKVQEFHDLQPESFGRNISLFKVTTSRVRTTALGSGGAQLRGGWHVNAIRNRI
jgi:dolichyl-phosphate-mannose-protein mannosyltransferase